MELKCSASEWHDLASRFANQRGLDGVPAYVVQEAVDVLAAAPAELVKLDPWFEAVTRLRIKLQDSLTDRWKLMGEQEATRRGLGRVS